jgi:tRNA nucleotidyltransferase/poly(A) polymerase
MEFLLEKIRKECPEAWQVWQVLTAHHPQTFLVGGSVRNLFLGVPAKDYDLATALTPAEIIEIAKIEGWRADEVGNSFGVVVLRHGDENIEVATFRKEGYGDDPHRPAWVEYGASLEEDLSRRDFTVNALAVTLSGQLVDLFGGQQDLKEKRIRAIGNPKDRFTEDALRMLRAIRFASQFSFTIEEGTKEAIRLLGKDITRLSRERITGELEKIWLSPNPAQAWGLFEELGLGEILFGSCWRGSGEGQKMNLLPAERVLRWGFVGWNLSKEAIGQKGLDKETESRAMWLASEADMKWQGLKTLRSWRESGLFRNETELRAGAEDWLRFREVIVGEKPEVAAEMRALLELPFFANQLAISGNEVLEFVAPGPAVGAKMQEMIGAIQEGQLANEKAAILDYLAEK